MILQQHYLGCLAQASYLIGDEKSRTAAVVDPRRDVEIYLDEAAKLGVLLNVTRRVNKTLSYVTTGQDVPNDIEVGQSRRLAQLVLGDGL